MSRLVVAPGRAALRLAFGALLLWLAAYEAHDFLAPHRTFGGLFGKQAHCVVLLCAAALTLLRVARRREDRLAWALIGAGVLGWAVGEGYYTTVLWNLSSVSSPTLADAGYLTFPVLTFAGVCVLARRRGRGAGLTLWADGVAAGLAVGSLSAAVVLDAVLRHTTGPVASVTTNLAYPVTDLVLLGACVMVVGLGGWRLERTWTLIGAGIVVFWISDSVYLIENSSGSYSNGGPFDMGWWLGLVLIALAAWQPRTSLTRRPRQSERSWTIAPPVAFVAIAVGVLTYGSLRGERLNLGAVLLAAGALAAVAARLVLTFRASLALLEVVRSESVTDSLTGLPNRRALTTALAEHVDDACLSGEPATLALYDLDGFKNYNDAFGHQAGDALLARVALNLSHAVGGRGYRMGGDEFCVLVTGSPDEVSETLEAAAAALAEQGEGFTVSASFGSVTVPAEADTAEDALRIADQRMYARKHGGRPSASRQSTDVLMRALAERYPDLDEHSQGVAGLAEAAAHGLGLGPEEVEAVRLAAELHDIGKVAIPETILEKPGPLDDSEWEYMRRHSVIGERIIAAAPSLHCVAKAVRASHERFDGGGYPDGLANEAIPLAARIIAVCDSYDAMVSDRPYSRPRTQSEAVSELRRCAGTQFDPVVVEAFCEALAGVGVSIG